MRHSVSCQLHCCDQPLPLAAVITAAAAAVVAAAEPYLAMHTYSFPALCCALTRRVALSTHTIRLPVTLGSRVPLCPVFSTRSMRLIQATT